MELVFTSGLDTTFCFKDVAWEVTLVPASPDGCRVGLRDGWAGRG